MKFTSDEVTLRSLALQDAHTLAELLNNKKVWDNLRDYIPFPYSKIDAEDYINQVSKENPMLTFAILYKKQLCGVVGLKKQTDIYRLSMEVGYWTGEPYWGKGIATKALQLITHYGFSTFNVERIFAGTFSFNRGSMRVLEKCGYQLEGIARSAAVKNNQIIDEHRYATLKSDWLK